MKTHSTQEIEENFLNKALENYQVVNLAMTKALESDSLGLDLGSIIYKLCDLGKIIQSLWASFLIHKYEENK